MGPGQRLCRFRGWVLKRLNLEQTRLRMNIPEYFAADDSDALIVRLARRWAGALISVDADGTPVGTHLPILWDGARKSKDRADRGWRTRR